MLQLLFQPDVTLQVTREGIVVALQQPIQRGFGMVFDQGDPQWEEQGGQVFSVRDAGSGAELESGSAGALTARHPWLQGRLAGTKNMNVRECASWLVQFQAFALRCSPCLCLPVAGTAVLLGFGRGQIDLREVQPGQLIWQTKNPVLEGRLKSSYDGLSAAAQRRLPVAVSVTATLGAPLRLVLTDSQVRWGRRGRLALVIGLPGSACAES